MKRKNLFILLVLCTSLILRADSCVLEQREVSQVSSLGVPAEFVSQGWTESSETQSAVVDISADVRDALEGVSVDNIEQILLAGAAYKVTASTGHDAARDGDVTVKTPGAGAANQLLTFDVPTNSAGTSGTAGDGTLTLVNAGVDFINTQVATWLDQYKTNPALADDSLLVFEYTATWNSNPPPSAQDPDNFTWSTDVILHVETIIDIEVPNP